METPLLLDVIDNLSRFLAAASVSLLGVYLYDWTTPFSFRVELSEKDNAALGTHLMGYVVALMLMLTGAMAGGGAQPAHPVDVVVFGLLAVVLLRAGAVCADRLILRGFSVWREILEDRNLGVAFVTAGALIGTGAILRGALTGDSAGLLAGMLTTVEYFVLSQAFLLLAAAVYLRVVRYRHGSGSAHGVVDELRDRDNAAVGLSFGGYLVGASLVVSAGITGDDIATMADVVAVVGTLALTSVLGVGTMLLVRPFVDRAVIPYASMADEIGTQRNVAIGGLSAAFHVGFGVILYGMTA